MKKNVKFLLSGFLFGIILSKSEVISWYRIYEMFRFQSFHMYGVIGSAVAVSAILIYFFKKGVLKNYLGQQVQIADKKKNYKAALLGGIVFGLGWALAGACPAPIFVLLGQGILPVLLVIFGALMGTFVYGLVHKKLPH